MSTERLVSYVAQKSANSSTPADTLVIPAGCYGRIVFSLFGQAPGAQSSNGMSVTVGGIIIFVDIANFLPDAASRILGAKSPELILGPGTYTYNSLGTLGTSSCYVCAVGAIYKR